MRNCTLSIVAMLGVAINLSLSFSTVHAQAVPDPVLYFDPLETDQDGGDTEVIKFGEMPAPPTEN
jgi:hypothetical protein